MTLLRCTFNAAFLSAIFALLFLPSCKKKQSDSFVSPDLRYLSNPVYRVAGIWVMNGTHDYLAHGFTHNINTSSIVWVADSEKIVIYNNEMYPEFSAFTVSKTSTSTYQFGRYTFDDDKDELKYYEFVMESGNYQKISMHSVSHTPFPKTTISSNLTKMEGDKYWHGSYKTQLLLDSDTGLIYVDTVFDDPIRMKINVIDDTLIMATEFYYGGNDVWGRYFLRKTYEDPSSMTFTSTNKPYQTITYYFGNNSMYYFDSTEWSTDVSKFYTP